MRSVLYNQGPSTERAGFFWLMTTEFAHNEMTRTVGRSSRDCLSKKTSLMETKKLAPELVLRFDIEMAAKDAEWTFYDDCLVQQEGFRAKISKRQETSMFL